MKTSRRILLKSSLVALAAAGIVVPISAISSCGAIEQKYNIEPKTDAKQLALGELNQKEIKFSTLEKVFIGKDVTEKTLKESFNTELWTVKNGKKDVLISDHSAIKESEVIMVVLKNRVQQNITFDSNAINVVKYDIFPLQKIGKIELKEVQAATYDLPLLQKVFGGTDLTKAVLDNNFDIKVLSFDDKEIPDHSSIKAKDKIKIKLVAKATAGFKEEVLSLTFPVE